MNFKSYYKTYKKKCLACETNFEIPINNPFNYEVIAGCNASQGQLLIREEDSKKLVSVSANCPSCHFNNIYDEGSI